ncbi:MAG: IreB family regulatory phosphoprotein [Eubacteriales bacterium]|nr:IreB family regulatory phosphoprotein [Eubacteriales bacterium]
MGVNSNTVILKKKVDNIEAPEVLASVYDSLKEKGYNPVNQLVGYIMSGDPTYITSHKNARSLIMKVERDEILEELITNYIKNVLEK